MVETGIAADRGVADQLRHVETIVSEHEKPLLRYAARLLRDATAAEDVVQNVFIKLCRGLDAGMESGGHLKAWLYRVTHNEAIDHLRREGRMRLLQGDQGELAVTQAVDTKAAVPGAGDDRHALVMQHVRRLHPREQQIVLLRLEEGLSYQAISTITGRSEGNVGNILHHAVRKLSVSLAKAGALPAREKGAP